MGVWVLAGGDQGPNGAPRSIPKSGYAVGSQSGGVTERFSHTNLHWTSFLPLFEVMCL